MIERAPGLSDAQYIEQLAERLREADDTLEAIRTGAVDALCIDTSEGVSVYTLESADRPYRTLVEQMQEGALSMSPEGVVLYGNDRLGRILQRPLEQVVGRAFADWVIAGEQARFQAFLAACNSQAMRGEFVLLTPGHVAVPVYLSFRGLNQEHPGNPIVCGVVTDLTEQRAMEARLSQAQKMEAVGQLTGGLAHDFNNLLQGIKGSLDLILRRSDSPRVGHWAQAGLKAADRGAKLTSQLLAFSRSQKLELKPLVVNEVIGDMTDLLVRTLGSGIRIRLDLEPTQHYVLSDPTQLELAILNLGINARDAMPGGGQLSITTSYLPGTATTAEAIQVCIADTGSGMSEQVRLSAFNPFFTTKDIGAGTGLGLAQVQSIVEQSHGRVRIDSTLGEGTRVYLTLPCTLQRPIHVQPAALADDSLATPGKRILLIDDDHEVRRVIIDMLEVLGHEVHESDNGFDGLQRLDAIAPDVLLLDFAMPHLNGAEVAIAVRSTHRHLPIIFISGFSDSEQLEAAVGPGVTVLRKPFTIQELGSMIEAGVR